VIRPIDLTDDDFWRLLLASRSGDLDDVKLLVGRRPELVIREYDYTAPLHFAVREGHLPVTRFLLDHGAKADYQTHRFRDSLLTMAQDRDHHDLATFFQERALSRFPMADGIRAFLDAARRGELERVREDLARDPGLAKASDDICDTALHQAALGGHGEVVNALLDAGADPDAVRADGRRPVICALHGKGSRAIVDTLLARGAAYNIYLAAALGDLPYVREALARDRTLANFEDSSHHRPISAAARRRDLEMVRLLLDHGADPSLPEHGAPLGLALWTAVYQNEPEMAKLLLEHGGNPNTAPESSGAAIGHARNNPELRQLLIQYGAIEDNSERRTLETLINENNLDEVETMLKRNASLASDPMTFWGEGILACPANRKRQEMVELLVRYGARVPDVSKWGPEYYFKHASIGEWLLKHAGMNPNLCNWQHFSLLHRAAADGDLTKMRLLLDHGADIDAVDEEYCSTPLGCAARWGQLDSVRYLLSRKADRARSGAPWSTPLAWAEKKGHKDIVAALATEPGV
jgi:ankyrin repeat protein